MALVLENINITDCNNKVLISSLNLSIKPGQILSLMGPSGCGKSTLLNVIAGHPINDFTTSGNIYLNDQLINKVPVEKRKIGMLFQDDLLFPHLNIWQNLALALPNSIKKTQRKEKALDVLDNLDLQFLANKAPDNVSGGQRARISLMRMLIAEPNAILLDEPFSKLDSTLRKDFRDWVFTQIKIHKLPTLMVTHDQGDLAPNDPVLIWPWDKKGMQND